MSQGNLRGGLCAHPGRGKGAGMRGPALDVEIIDCLERQSNLYSENLLLLPH